MEDIKTNILYLRNKDIWNLGLNEWGRTADCKQINRICNLKDSLIENVKTKAKKEKNEIEKKDKA